jgi:hypothetical protein
VTHEVIVYQTKLEEGKMGEQHTPAPGMQLDYAHPLPPCREGGRGVGMYSAASEHEMKMAPSRVLVPGMYSGLSRRQGFAQHE